MIHIPLNTSALLMPSASGYDTKQHLTLREVLLILDEIKRAEYVTQDSISALEKILQKAFGKGGFQKEWNAYIDIIRLPRTTEYHNRLCALGLWIQEDTLEYVRFRAMQDLQWMLWSLSYQEEDPKIFFKTPHRLVLNSDKDKYKLVWRSDPTPIKYVD